MATTQSFSHIMRCMRMNDEWQEKTLYYVSLCTCWVLTWVLPLTLLPLLLPVAHASTNQSSHAALPGHATLTVAAVGDIMLGTNYPFDRLPEPDSNLFFENVTASLLQADIVIANFEGVLTDQDSSPKKQCDDASKCFLFRSPPHYAKHLRNAGINAVSLANNHSHDFGNPGFRDSKFHLAANGIQTSGGKGDYAIWPDREVRTAMVAFSTYDHVNNMNDIANARAIVSRLDNFYDVVIVSFHGGAEGINKSHLPFATEYFHGEKRGDVVAFSRAMVDSGADLVVGHGPHVPRAIELHNGRLIAYSLGNFITHEGIRIKGKFGYAPILLATLNHNGEFICGNIVSAQQSREHGLQLDANQLAYKEIRQLTNQDLSGGGLYFSDNGQIDREEKSNSFCQQP